ncbi:MAG: hypothetical protein WCS70_09110 [Verrucomicrobiota bacterium]
MPGKKLKFPETKDYAAKEAIVLCPSDRVIGLYNQATGKSAERIAKKMKEWFVATAKQKGWVECQFVPEVQSKHGAGCVLLNPLSVRVTVNQIIISK